MGVLALQGLSRALQMPWLVAGDLNQVAASDEKRVGGHHDQLTGKLPGKCEVT